MYIPVLAGEPIKKKSYMYNWAFFYIDLCPYGARNLRARHNLTSVLKQTIISFSFKSLFLNDIINVGSRIYYVSYKS